MKTHSKYTLLLFIFLLAGATSCADILGLKDDKEDTGGKTIIETGELAAINSRAFVLPRYGRQWYEMRIIGLLEHGTIVKPGDSIIQIDPTEIKKYIVERKTNLENQLATLEKMKVDKENRSNELNSAIRSQTASFNLSRVELEASVFESERAKRIKELEFEQAKITLQKEEKKLELNEIVEVNDLKIQEIRVRQIQNEIQNAYDILPTLTIRSPIAGVFQIERNRRTGTLLNVGDNVYPGANMANVPALEKMKVNTWINENDFLKIRTGQKVIVRLDAMPNLTFEGKVTYIDKLCKKKDEKSRQKVFDVEVEILQHDERLKPGMTISCEYIQNS